MICGEPPVKDKGMVNAVLDDSSDGGRLGFGFGRQLIPKSDLGVCQSGAISCGEVVDDELGVADEVGSVLDVRDTSFRATKRRARDGFVRDASKLI